MIKDIINILGKSIRSEEVKVFIEKNGLKYPKKDCISWRKEDDSIWIENKKIGFSLLFGIDFYNQKYPPIPAEKKGTFVFRLNEVRFNEKFKADFPFDLNFNLDFDKLKEKLGDPGLKSSDISPTWLNDDGSESFFRWNINLNDERDICLSTQYDNGQGIRDIIIGVKSNNPLFSLYNNLAGDSFATVAKNSDTFDIKQKLTFLHWAVKKDLFKKSKQNRQALEKVKLGELPILDFLKENIKRGYILTDDFSEQQDFIKKYISNLSGKDIVYQRDFAYTFLDDEKLRDNYLGSDAFDKFKTIEMTNENVKKIESVINRRLNEYQEHKFEKSNMDV